MSCLKKYTRKPYFPPVKAKDKSSGMANVTTVQTSCIQENHEDDECRENIPPGVAAVTGTPKLKVQVEDVVGYSSTQQSGENEPLSDTCTFSTPAPTNSNVKAKSRLSGLHSALTPILRYLNIGNKCSSPETLTCGNNPHATAPSLSFGNTMANCQKSTGDSSQRSNTDFTSSHSGRSLGDTNASVCWLADECLPEITLLDVTCDTTMQLTKNNLALPDMHSTPATAGSVCTFITPQPSTNLNTTPQICPQNNTLDPPQSNIRSPKVESEAKGQASAVSVMNQCSSACETGGSCDGLDVTFDRRSLQKSGVLGEAGAATFCPQNDTFNTKPSKKNGTITVSETNSCDSHQTSQDKPSPKVCNAKENYSQIDPAEVSKYNWITASKDPNDNMVDIPESIDAPLRWLDDRLFPEITLLDVTCDSEFSPIGKMSSTEDSFQNSMPSSALSGQTVAEPGTSDMTQSEDLSSTLDGNITHTTSSLSEQSDKCVGENIPKASLEVTRDISVGSVLEDSQPSLVPSGQNMVKTRASVEDTLGANVTHDISSSSDMSLRSAVSQSSASDTQCNTSSKNVAFELHGEPVPTSYSVDANNEELLTSHDAELTRKVPQPNPKTAESANGTFTIVEQLSNLTRSTNANTTAQIQCPQNKTLKLPPSNVNSPKVESETNDEPTSVSENTTETSPVINQNCSSVKPSGSCDVQNVTFDRHSLQKSSNNTVLGEAGATTFSLQNNTFNMKSSKQNGTITVSETSSNDSHQSTLDKVCNSTSSPKDNNSEVHPPKVSKHNGTTASTDSDAKTVSTSESTFESNPAVGIASGAAQRETKDGLSNTLGYQSMDTEENKGNTFNLDDTLDLRADSLITSTPMINSKMFNFHTEREEGKTIGAQKKLYGDCPSKPDVQVPPDVPSNIGCDRKKLLPQPAVKSLLPPLKAASQLLKNKPASALPGRFEPVTSGLPVTRQRTQAEALRNSASASDAPQVVGF